MKCKLAGFFNKKSILKDKQINDLETSASPATPSFTVPHKVQKIELTNLNGEAITLLLTPSLQTNDVLHLCQSIKQDFDLFSSQRTTPISIEAKQNFCVLVHIINPDNFLNFLKNAKAITEEVKREVLQRIHSHTTLVTPQKV